MPPASRANGLGRNLGPNCTSTGGQHGIWQIHPRWHGAFGQAVEELFDDDGRGDVFNVRLVLTVKPLDEGT